MPLPHPRGLQLRYYHFALVEQEGEGEELSSWVWGKQVKRMTSDLRHKRRVAGLEGALVVGLSDGVKSIEIRG